MILRECKANKSAHLTYVLPVAVAIGDVFHLAGPLLQRQLDESALSGALRVERVSALWLVALKDRALAPVIAANGARKPAALGPYERVVHAWSE